MQRQNNFSNSNKKDNSTNVIAFKPKQKKETKGDKVAALIHIEGITETYDWDKMFNSTLVKRGPKSSNIMNCTYQIITMGYRLPDNDNLSPLAAKCLSTREDLETFIRTSSLYDFFDFMIDEINLNTTGV